MRQQKIELIADVAEALEKLQDYKPLYLAVLQQTKCRRQAIQAVKWAVEMEKQIEEEKVNK